MRNCWFEENNTVSGTSYVLMSLTLNAQGALMENCVFLRNGYDSSSKLINLHASNEDTRDEISRCIFIGNEGRVLELEQAHYSDTDYGNSTYGRKIDGNVFIFNGQPLYFNGEPALKMTSFMNNIFWNNTTEDVPSYVSGGTGFGPNRVVDPKFVNGLSGDFRAYDDSPVWLYKNDMGTPVGGNFVQRASPVFVGDTGDLSLSSGNTGDVVEVSGRSFQKISQNPIVWRRYNATVASDSAGYFVPSDVSNLVAWYDASDSSTITLSGDDVTEVANKVSGGPTLYVYGSAPHIDSAALNGKDVFDLDVADGFHTNGVLTNSGTTTIFFVMDMENDSQAVLFTDDSHEYAGVFQSGESNKVIDSNAGTPLYHVNGGSGLTGGNDETDSITRGTMYNTISNNTGFNIVGGIGYDFGTWGDFKIAGYTSPWQLQGRLAEMLVFEKNLTTDERQKVEGFLAHKWDLTGKLPSDHPYKIYGP